MPKVNDNFLQEVFPFHLLLDDQLRIAGFGSSASKLSPGLAAGTEFTELVRLVSPRGPINRELLLANRHMVVFCELLASGIKLRGQIIHLESTGQLAYLCSPWLEGNEDLKRFSLTEADFAPHEASLDHLYLVHTRNQQLQDLKVLNEKLQRSISEAERLSDAEAALTRDLEVAADLRIHVLDGRIESVTVNHPLLEALAEDLQSTVPLSQCPRWLRELAAAANENCQSGGAYATKLTLDVGSARRSLDIRIACASDDELILLARDVTDAETEYMLLLEVLEQALEAVVFVDEDDRIVFFNKSAEDLFLFSKREVLGRHIDVLSESRMSDRREYVGRGWLHSGCKRKHSGETQLVRKDRSVLLCSYSVSHVRLGGNLVIAAFIEDITEKRSSEEQIRRQANYDSLTGLPNRNRFMLALKAALSTPGTTALALIDLDDFKTVNDLLGHAAGDLFLQTAAERIQASISERDMACRLGGDEFAIILQGLDSPDSGPSKVQAMLEALEAPVVIDNVHWGPTASVGIALNDSAKTAADLLRNADLAMYEAKARGKGQLCRYSPRLTQRALRRIDIQKKLEDGLERGEIFAHYQPIWDIQENRPFAFEALARWTLPSGKSVSPEEFIPIAENSDLIVRIEEQLVEHAIETLGRLRSDNARFGDLCININISARHFVRPSLIPLLKVKLALHGIDPSSLTLELTESLLLSDSKQVRDRFASLRDLGVRIALDDFGTGYSSLSYLERYKFDLMKIDRSFVRELTTRHIRRRLTETMVAVGRVIGIDVVAEGVETVQDVEILRDMGCRFGQGYYFAKPMSSDDLENWLAGSDTSRLHALGKQ